MSKDDVCKVTSASKHKERKPKKPHYIPRPWGKPYNYKCFQCPFTCMEKSHLYNHMKYSLCKNSLSLLIESDWPYKKGNILHPDQLRPFQQAHGLHAGGKDDAEQALRSEEKSGQRRSVEEEGESRESHREEEEEGREEQVEVTKKMFNRGDAADGRFKEPVSELLMTDVLSLEDQLFRARSVEVEAHLRQQKLPKSCLSAPGLLSEHWRLLASSHMKTKAEGAPARVSGSIPCYPPPPNLVDYQDPTGLNLSMFGVGYPISPSLFSYMNSAIPAAASSAGSQSHAQLTQLPFLASASQLMHPASSAHTDRTILPSRLYPFLCEHTFGPSPNEAGKSLKTTSTNCLDAGPLSGFQPKVNLWKVPALMPGNAVSPAGWVSSQRDSPDQNCRSEEKVSKESKASSGFKRTGSALRSQETPPEKKSTVGFAVNLLKNIQTDKLLFQSSLQDAQLQARSSDLWCNNPLTSPNSESVFLKTSSQDSSTAGRTREGASESVAALLTDLSKALQEYQEAEHKISHLEKEDLSAQRHLWEHLGKIRSELSHIHQALERTAVQSDGPLDLSVKRDSTDSAAEPIAQEDGGLQDNLTETEEEEDEELEEKKEDEGNGKAMRASLESRKQSLDMLIKISQASVVNTDVLTPGGLGLRPAEALWPSRTTKCEADSSVLLCPDGRSVMFTDIPSSIKPQRRSPSIHRLESQCPLSPLAAPDS
ncbi:Proline-rich protein 35 [Oryzias melastigma]|uniref:Proline rich 35 n=1 Tax=Oryzias melastigma TaxID=30732 RepID=A0A3B3CCA1_ORYME|nr:proline-rich protein 35 [Oryzias melastigma]XP_036073118.1 proline-rich protein 35 [Oryzias melastigma]KAF6734796.1 Proline-rich protein 35 [Oryzias melastigma]